MSTVPSTETSKHLFCAVEHIRPVPPETWVGIWKMELREYAKLGFTSQPFDHRGFWASDQASHMRLLSKSLMGFALNMRIFANYVKNGTFDTRVEQLMQTSTGSTLSTS